MPPVYGELLVPEVLLGYSHLHQTVAEISLAIIGMVDSDVNSDAIEDCTTEYLDLVFGKWSSDLGVTFDTYVRLFSTALHLPRRSLFVARYNLSPINRDSLASENASASLIQLRTLQHQCFTFLRGIQLELEALKHYVPSDCAELISEYALDQLGPMYDVPRTPRDFTDGNGEFAVSAPMHVHPRVIWPNLTQRMIRKLGWNGWSWAYVVVRFVVYSSNDAMRIIPISGIRNLRKSWVMTRNEMLGKARVRRADGSRSTFRLKPYPWVAVIPTDFVGTQEDLFPQENAIGRVMMGNDGAWFSVQAMCSAEVLALHDLFKSASLDTRGVVNMARNLTDGEEWDAWKRSTAAMQHGYACVDTGSGGASDLPFRLLARLRRAHGRIVSLD